MKPDFARLWAEASRIADTAGSWPRLMRSSIATLGYHPKRQAGSGSDFWQYRALSPGESAGQIDWRKSARSDALLVRDHELEVPARLFIWCDQSPSMTYTSTGSQRSKAEWAYVLGAAIVQAAAASGETVAAFGHNGNGSGLARLRTLMPLMSSEPAAAAMPSNSVLIIVSDCLGLEAWIAELSKQSVRARTQLVLVQVHDPAEASFPFTGRVEFTGMEGEKSMEVDDARAARADYLGAWQKFQSNLKNSVQINDNMYLSYPTDNLPKDCFEQILAHLGRR
jgi:uncharacterized protein (DUF58 family)